jgi:hypothetical protein
MNERAVNIKQNQSYHLEMLPDPEYFRENIQAGGCRIAAPGVLASRRRVVRQGLAGETPALPGNSGSQAFGLRVSPQA